MHTHRSLHLVQVSADDSVLDPTAGTEARRRQTLYGRILRGTSPGSRMTVIVLSADADRRPIENDAVEFVPVSLRGHRRQRARELYRALQAIDRRRPIDLVTTQNPDGAGVVANAFASRRHIPVVAQLHYDLFSPAAGRTFGVGWRAALRKRLAIRQLRTAAALRVVGTRIGEAARRAGVGGRIDVLPVPVEMAAQPPRVDGVRERRVLFVGRLQPEKNLHRWLAVAARLAATDPDVRFDIVGEGPLRREIEQRAADLGIANTVTFHGFVPYEQLGRLYARASVFLLTSDYEGFGRVIVESYCHGTPTVAVRIAGVEDIVVDGQTGFLRDVDDVEGLASAVTTLLTDPARAREMGRAGSEDVRHRFDPQSLASRWMQLLVESAERAAPRRREAVLMPRPRTLRRWRRIAGSRTSLLRALEYEAINGLALEGRTLDVGGATKNSYYHLLRVDGRIDSLNLDATLRPTCVGDLNRALPLRDHCYDNVLSLNTFEHIPNDRQLLVELLRVLKPGGHFHIIVPFLYPVHGMPTEYHDYHRHTAQWWHDEISRHVTAAGDIQIEPLVWDRMTSALSLWDVSRTARSIVMLVSVVRDVRWWHLDRLPATARQQIAVDYPLGYYIRGRK